MMPPRERSHNRATMPTTQPPVPLRPRVRRLLQRASSRPLTATLLAGAAWSAWADVPVPRESPLRIELGFERLRLPGVESMGLAGTTVLFRLGEGWWAGPAFYGAASGQRGGLFVGGAELRRQWRLPADWELGTGLYAGGGGGAAAPVGGGLMLRAAASLTRPVGPLRAGFSLSHVRFPSGDIASSQLGVLLSWERPFRSFDAAASGQAPSAAGSTGLGFQRIAGTVGRYALRAGDSRRVGIVGARAEWPASPGGWFTGIEAAAAASGGAAGYMEVLGAAGWRYAPPAWPTVTLEARGALGLGGGGAMPTEGGPIAKWSVGVGLDLGRGWRTGIDEGAISGIGSPLRARTTHLWLAMELEPVAGAPPGAVERHEWSASVQRVSRAQRSNGPTAPLDTVGVKLNRFVGAHTYFSGQAHSAFAGGAGAYSIGLIGVGWASLPGGMRFGAELLAGAAGGGGVASGGGAIGQAVAWTSIGVTPDSEIRLGLGAVRSLRGGDLRSTVLELAWTRAFGLGGR